MEIEGPFDSFWIPSSSDSLQGCSSMFKFDNSSAEMKPLIAQLVSDDNDLDRSLNQQEKKRRLSVDKVRFLERNFDVENKLGPDRKIQLAKELGLQPRQIAIWFQNRRARYKTKQLEKDYDSLKASYDELKDNCDHLFKENEDLKNQVDLLKEKLQEKQKSKPCDLPIELDKKPIFGSNSRSTENVKTILESKQEDVNSIKSDVIDSESIESCHVNTISNNSLLLEPANSSHAFELDQPGDFSQDEEDNFSKSLMTLPSLPKLESDQPGDFSQDEEDNFSKSLMILPSLPKLEDSWIISCYNYPVEDQSFWSWPY